ncbi:MAG: class I SAM-dependent methyltransferase [Methylosarcina sp.]
MKKKPAGQLTGAPYLKLPYFDYLLDLLDQGQTAVERSFGRHVHWGYWEKPELAELTPDDFAAAAEALTAELCGAGRIANGLRVLDAGCGFGGTLAHINEHYSNMKLTGLNLDGRQLQRARKLTAPEPDNTVEFVQGDACRLPFPDRSFDVVLAVECIFHFPSREHFFREVRRVLAPGGYLAISDFIPAPLIVPFAKIRLPERLSRGFYGHCNLQYTDRDYRLLAGHTHFDVPIARDITAHTLPTYAYLRRLARETSVYDGFAMIETATLELLSRMRLMNYYIYSFQKKS